MEFGLLNAGGPTRTLPHTRVGEVFVIAVVAALDAGLLAAAVVMLGRPRPARQLVAYLIGGMTFSIIIGLLIVFALRGSSLLRGPDKSTRAVIEVAAGALLIVIAAAVLSGRQVQWHPRRSRKRDTEHARQSLPERALGHDSLWIAWGLPVPRTAAPGAEYLAGLALLAKLNASPVANVGAILGFNVVMFALIELPLLGLALLPDRTQALTEKLNTWMTSHRRTLIVIVAGAGGAYVLISGLTDLKLDPAHQHTRHSSHRSARLPSTTREARRRVRSDRKGSSDRERAGSGRPEYPARRAIGSWWHPLVGLSTGQPRARDAEGPVPVARITQTR